MFCSVPLLQYLPAKPAFFSAAASMEGVRSGMENARAKGRQIGRPQVSKEDIPATFLRHYPAHTNGQLNISELARVCDISRTTAYKYIGLLEA